MQHRAQGLREREAVELRALDRALPLEHELEVLAGRSVHPEVDGGRVGELAADGLVALEQEALELLVLRVQRQPGVAQPSRLHIAAHHVQGKRPAVVGLAPVRLQLQTRRRVSQTLVPLLEGRVARAAVAVEDSILRTELDRLAVLLQGRLVLLRLIQLVPFRFMLLGLASHKDEGGEGGGRRGDYVKRSRRAAGSGQKRRREDSRHDIQSVVESQGQAE
eukprot:767582-Hanusia_phi.AAC.4